LFCFALFCFPPLACYSKRWREKEEEREEKGRKTQKGRKDRGVILKRRNRERDGCKGTREKSRKEE
jgi:hypothetical protein